MATTPNTQVSTPRVTIAPTRITIEKMVGCGTCSASTGSASTCRASLDDFEEKGVK